MLVSVHLDSNIFDFEHVTNLHIIIILLLTTGINKNLASYT